MLHAPIHHTFGPHATVEYALRSITALLQPWSWRRGQQAAMLRQQLEHHFAGSAFLFSTGREALLAYLRAIGLKSGEEVILPAYTCVVVPNAVHAAGGVPVYADVEGDTLNLDSEDVKRRITPRTRAVLAQHTFGIPANLPQLRALCDRHRLLLIEDCAHVLPDAAGPPIGRSGDCVLLSFGRDKAISGVTGGGVIVRDASVALRLTEAEHTAADVSGGTVARLLLYPMIYGKARLLWRIGLGRPFLRVCKALRLLLPITTAEEKRGRMSVTLHRMPNACATLALSSLLRLKHLNDHRRALTHFYTEAAHRHGWSVPRAIADPGGRNQEHGPATLLPLQKFPLFVVDADGMRALLKRENIYLEDGWTGCTICPRGTDLPSVNYTAGSDPVAEHSSERILALPTHPTMTLRGAKRLVRTLDVALRDRT